MSIRPWLRRTRWRRVSGKTHINRLSFWRGLRNSMPGGAAEDHRMYKKIGDYGIIGNSQSVALVGSDGSIDWLCLPSMDSASVFAALLDHDQGGRFAVTPEPAWDSSQHYIPGTNVLVTTFRT